MKKIVLLGCVLLSAGNTWGMVKKPYLSQDIFALNTDEIASWFATLDESTLPKKGGPFLNDLIFEVGANKDSQWIEEFIKKVPLKNLLLLQSNDNSTVLHHTVDFGYVDSKSLLEKLNALNFALPTLRPLKNNYGKTAYDIYMEKDKDYRTDEIEKLLNHSTSTQPSGSSALKLFNILTLDAIKTADDARRFIDELDPKSLPQNRSQEINTAHIKLANLDTAPLTILLKSAKLAPLITSVGSGGEGLLHKMARINPSVERIQLALDAGASKTITAGTDSSATPLKNYEIITRDKTADPKIIALLDPISPSKKPVADPKKVFNINDLIGIFDEQGAQKFIDSLDEDTILVTNDFIEKTHNALNVKNNTVLTILLKSPKLKKLLTAKDAAERTLLHEFVQYRSNVTPQEIQLLIDLGIDKGAKTKIGGGLFGARGDKTALDLYKAKFTGYFAENPPANYQEIITLLDPTPSKGSGQPSLKEFKPSELQKITTQAEAQQFINELDPTTVPTAGDVIGLVHFALLEIKDFNALKVLLESEKLKPLLTAKNQDNSETLLHVFVDRPNVTAQEIELVLNLGIDKNAQQKLGFLQSGKTAAEMYKHKGSLDSAVAALLDPKGSQPQPAPGQPTPITGGKKPYNLEQIIHSTLQLDDIDPDSIPNYITRERDILFYFTPEKLRAFATHPTTRTLITLKDPSDGGILIHSAAKYARNADDEKEKQDYREKIRALAEAGSDLTTENNEKKTPLVIYTESKYFFEGGKDPEIIALLTPRPLDARISTLAQALHTLKDKIDDMLGLFD